MKPLHLLSPGAYRRRATAFSVLAIALVAASLFMGFNPSMLFTEFHFVIELFNSMSPPNLRLLWSDGTIGMAVLETVSMAFLGTVIGGSLAVGMAFFAAGNTMPGRLVRLTVRFVLSISRVIPPLFIILVMVASVGLGPFAGMLALTVTTTGTFGQLFAEIIENSDPAPADAIYSVGATRWQVIRYAIIPQVTPALIANLFYALDINIRLAIGLGIFGGGGIGFQLFQAMRVLHYRDALALILLTTVLIVISEKLSDWLRSRFLIVSLAK